MDLSKVANPSEGVADESKTARPRLGKFINLVNGKRTVIKH